MPKRPVKSVLWTANNVQELRDVVQIAQQFPVHAIACHDAAAAKSILLQQPIDLAVVHVCGSSKHVSPGLSLIRHMTSHFPDTVVVARAHPITKDLQKKMQNMTEVPVYDAGSCVQNSFMQIAKNHLACCDLQQKSSGRGDYVQPLEDFLAQEEIRAFLQPIVSIEQTPGQITQCHGLEALARPPEHLPFWHPGFLFTYACLQEQFLPTDLKCIEAAFRSVSELSSFKSLATLPKLFVNLHPRSLITPQFAPALLQLVKRFDLNPAEIVLELTEQQAFINPSVIVATLSKLRKRGFKVALDDFGEGFSNLQFVQAIKPDYLKLSGSFCHDLPTDRHKQIIVQTVVQMAKQLSIQTVLEQVETEQELYHARKLGIDYAQGYLFSAGLAHEELRQALPLCF
ncbi:MAG: EAL domain-containing protein [Myxococcota bacterium]